VLLVAVVEMAAVAVFAVVVVGVAEGCCGFVFVMVVDLWLWY
jgi:hypothetical protein